MKNQTPLTDIFPAEKVMVEQGFCVMLEKKGFTRDVSKTMTVTMHYGRRPLGTKIYSVPIFDNGNIQVAGKAVSVGFEEAR